MNQYELWIEGNKEYHASFVGIISGTDFDDAIERYVFSLSDKDKVHWKYNQKAFRWEYKKRVLFDDGNCAKSVKS